MAKRLSHVMHSSVGAFIEVAVAAGEVCWNFIQLIKLQPSTTTRFWFLGQLKSRIRSPKLKCCSNVNCRELSANSATNRLPNLCKQEARSGVAAQINSSIKRMKPIESPHNGPLSASHGYDGGGANALQIC
ncbi:hypothetical protein CEXT_71671 [Caerostris extrusa]|uniref:Uncharacterized protein n=1 Tax=Caerostris extrusa TaxID=172846 RepID=A0AAV4XXU3_CAEEX|nr:hypothetical protein CEXT_71671 [Caerostris extrusa]